MATHAELVAQARELDALIDAARRAELASVKAEILAKMREYGLTLEDLKQVSVPKPKSPVQFIGPKGETWAGSAGRKPTWVKEVLSQGKSLEDFRVNREVEVPTATPPVAPPVFNAAVHQALAQQAPAFQRPF